jgi:hypothetical protein
MSSLSFLAEPTFSTTVLFNNGAAAVTISVHSPSQSSQGSISLHQSPNCSFPLSETPTPLLLGECLNTPFSGIGSVAISSLPSCPDNGTPLLIVSDHADCKISSSGTGADSGELQKCLDYGGPDIGSMGFTCYGDGLVATGSAATSPMAARGLRFVAAAAVVVVVVALFWE